MTSWSPTEQKHGTPPREIRSAMVPAVLEHSWLSWSSLGLRALLGGLVFLTKRKQVQLKMHVFKHVRIRYLSFHGTAFGHHLRPIWAAWAQSVGRNMCCTIFWASFGLISWPIWGSRSAGLITEGTKNKTKTRTHSLFSRAWELPYNVEL